MAKPKKKCWCGGYYKQVAVPTAPNTTSLYCSKCGHVYYESVATKKREVHPND